MNYKQYLYSKLAEEASEVAQAAIKTQLFGEYSTDPRETTGETNISKLCKELMDMTAVLELLDKGLEKENIKDDFEDPDIYIKGKKVKLKQHWAIVEELQ